MIKMSIDSAKRLGFVIKEYKNENKKLVPVLAKSNKAKKPKKQRKKSKNCIKLIKKKNVFKLDLGDKIVSS